jgi:hypothetical protein
MEGTPNDDDDQNSYSTLDRWTARLEKVKQARARFDEWLKNKDSDGFLLLDPPILHGIREPNVPFDSCGFCQLQQAYHKSVKEFQAHQDVIAKENQEEKNETVARGRRGTSLTRRTSTNPFSRFFTRNESATG